MNLPFRSFVTHATKALATDYHKVVNALKARDARSANYTRVGNQLIKK